MAYHSYVLSKQMMGTGKDDISLDITQLRSGATFEIERPLDVIAEEMYMDLEPYIDSKYRVETFRRMFNKNGRYSLKLFDDSGRVIISKIIVTVDNGTSQYRYDIYGDVRTRQVFSVTVIEDAYLCYLVSEHIINPMPGCDLIQRCYHTAFRDLEQALNYKAKMMKNYKIAQGKDTSGFRLCVADSRVLKKSNWYNTNIEIAKDIEQYNLDMEDYRYMTNLNEIKMAIFADAYDDLSVGEQGMVNMHIYETLRPYIDEEELIFFDEEVNSASSADLEGLADDAILHCLLHAKSEEIFNEIHEKLGPNEYRVGALTDDIYRDNPNKGYIVVSIDGEFGWYPECYAINEWEGAKGNPFYGVFQQNWNDTLLCLKEYHPEMIPDRLPKRMDMKKYDDMYQQEMSVVRGAHAELHYEEDEFSGEILAYGDWYYAGLFSPKCLRNISFPRKYGSHEFTEDECKRLLSGEELAVEGYKTKGGTVLTIKGMLKDCSDDDATSVDVQFVRTDIDERKRASMFRSLGLDGG